MGPVATLMFAHFALQVDANMSGGPHACDGSAALHTAVQELAAAILEEIESELCAEP